MKPKFIVQAGKSKEAALPAALAPRGGSAGGFVVARPLLGPDRGAWGCASTRRASAAAGELQQHRRGGRTAWAFWSGLEAAEPQGCSLLWTRTGCMDGKNSSLEKVL